MVERWETRPVWILRPKANDEYPGDVACESYPTLVDGYRAHGRQPDAWGVYENLRSGTQQWVADYASPRQAEGKIAQLRKRAAAQVARAMALVNRAEIAGM